MFRAKPTVASSAAKASVDRFAKAGSKFNVQCSQQLLLPLKLMSEDQPTKPPRRKRYAGTHPRRFEEKYKEHDPARFAQELEKVKARGQTPAGTHRPIMVDEIIATLRPAADDVILDCTLGYGGHTEALARKAGAMAKIIATDLDAEELQRTTGRLAAAGIKVNAHHTNFAGLGNVLQKEGLDGVDVLLADLGVSSMQLDRPERGFSFKANGPIDMRMDRSRGQSAADWLAAVDEEELAQLLTELGDEPEAAHVAAGIKKAFRGPAKPRKTKDLVDVVLQAKGINPRTYRRSSAFDTHPAARTFQAVRMAVNREPANLQQLLRLIPHVLHPGGRAAILTFHSGEEKLVGTAIRAGLQHGFYSAASETPLRPAPAEVHDNPRARSARLWWMRRALDGC
jgi:16S rRNA (cytosine1402-N4)-methyltransferase